MAQKRRLTDNDLYLRSITEKDFQHKIIKTGEALGWLIYHTYDSRQCVAGFPDLYCIHMQHGVFVAELKTETGRMSEAQKTWREYFLAQRVEYHLWRPRDWPLIEKRLKGEWLPDQYGSFIYPSRL